MIVRKVIIGRDVKIKTYYKHGVRFREIREALLNKPLLRKTRDGKYMAINLVERYMTIIFAYYGGTADIITAYPSSNWQIKLFKRKRW